MQSILKGLRRELLRLLHDPRGLFMFLIAPLLLNIVVCGAFQNGIVNHIRLAAVDMDSSAKTRELIRTFDDSDRFDVTAVLQDTETAEVMLAAGEVEGVLVIPADYTRALQLGQQAEVLVGINSTNNIVGNSAVVSVMQVVKTVSSQIAVKSYVAAGDTVADGTAKVMPISTVLRPWFNPQFSYLTYLGLGLTGLVFHQLFLTAVASSFAEEKEGGFLSGNGKRREELPHFCSKLLFYAIAGFLNIWLNYAVIMKLFGFPMRGSWGDLLLLCACLIFCLLGIGGLVGMLCKNVIHVMQWLMALTYPFFILSGFSWPHSEMPAALVSCAQLLPVTHFLNPVRDIVLMGIGYERASLAYSRNMLLLLGIAAMALCVLVFLRQEDWKARRAGKSGKEAMQG